MKKLFCAKNLVMAGLFVFSAAFLLFVADFVDPQATIDAAYYHILTDQLQAGKGFEEPFIWLHLNKYDNLTHSMDYWLPFGVVCYYLVRVISGETGEILLNVMLWSFLVTLVFSEIFRRCKSLPMALTGALCLLFAGRNLFYLLTTDNLGIYATLGYFFITILSDDKPNFYIAGFLAGLIALTRIEGVIFAFAGLVWLVYLHRNARLLLPFLAAMILTLSPWIIRNIIVLGRAWTSNAGALFVHRYYDLYDDKFPASFAYFMQQPLSQIIFQRISALWKSFFTLYLVPAHFLLLLLWIPGLVSSWKKDGRIFLFLNILFWLQCAILYPHQSENGTAVHISAFFAPHFAVFAGLGLHHLSSKRNYHKWFQLAVAFAVVLWSGLFSYLNVSALAKVHEERNRPYRNFCRQISAEKHSKIVSINPVYVYFVGRFPGVVSLGESSQQTKALADRYGCNYILFDTQVSNFDQQDYPGWKKVFEESFLVAIKKRT